MSDAPPKPGETTSESAAQHPDMSSLPPAKPEPVVAQTSRRAAVGWPFWAAALLALAALFLSGMLWQKLATIQEQLARQSADSATQAVEARTVARAAQEQSRETAARIAVMEIRLSEVSLQRSQLEALMQSLSRSQDENMVVDIESAVRLAQQQAQLTGSVEPLLAALRTADQRVARAAQPRLTRLRAALARDMDRIKTASVSDLPGLLVKLDELVREADDLPIANAAAQSVGASRAKGAASGAAASGEVQQWWSKALAAVLGEARSLVRVSRIEHPEAALISPEQAFFLRENLKLKLLNARLGLLARHTDSARADVAAAAQALGKYFDSSSKKTQNSLAQLRLIQSQMRTLDLPRIDDTLAALATAAAGR